MFHGIFCTTLYFRDSTHSRKAALLVLLCIALSPVHVFHSQEARMYALVSLFTLVGMATFLLGLRTTVLSGGHFTWLPMFPSSQPLLCCLFATCIWTHPPAMGTTIRLTAFSSGELGTGLMVVILLLWVSRYTQTSRRTIQLLRTPFPLQCPHPHLCRRQHHPIGNLFLPLHAGLVFHAAITSVRLYRRVICI
jgi:hypothetical protein